MISLFACGNNGSDITNDNGEEGNLPEVDSSNGDEDESDTVSPDGEGDGNDEIADTEDTENTEDPKDEPEADDGDENGAVDTEKAPTDNDESNDEEPNNSGSVALPEDKFN